jgi:hypothetical protein
MENRYKFHKKAWNLLQEHISEQTPQPTVPTKDYVALCLEIAKLINPLALQLHKLDAKFPTRPDGSSILESAELASIADGFESVAKYCHNEGCGRLEIVKMFGSLTKRLGDYWNVVSEHANNVGGIHEILIELAHVVQRVRKEFRKL